MTTPKDRARAAVVSGLATTAYYAVPDLLHSRRARGWAKVACLVPVVAVSLPTSREEWDELRTSARDARAALAAAQDGGTEAAAQEGGTEAAAQDDEAVRAGSSVRFKVAMGAAAAVALVGSTVATVAAERWVFRRGEARAAAGVRYPHTRTALVLGVLSAAVGLIPEPSESR
ncbi:hypothetical protein [Cellulomonas wangsupingiae]|uniref:Peptidase S9 n=1 Tax=Cellulomonas wangsupingiae TaxID=2968085 RepID=A0ABY5K434_9CELL|nr:hypothetical protein [Cellulomonas wangsupingiae]MCC2333962.1 hypothetical protein [Cellulomonas wangsupingiae]MCM0640982.1 hypothetical protein [Cellulomonas wangsupingiae]UUI65217.1 hypothetical protein NP075_00260 [Cellulomonas wangsupingiae]